MMSRTIIRGMNSLMAVSALFYASYITLQAEPDEPLLRPGTSCGTSAVSGASCYVTCPHGTIASCVSGLIIPSCTCIQQGGSPQPNFPISQVTAADADKVRFLPDFLDTYGTSEATALAQHVRSVIAAYDAYNPEAYSEAESGFSLAYEASSHELRDAIADAIGNDGLVPWREPIGRDVTCDASVTATITGVTLPNPVHLDGAATFHYQAISSLGDDIAWAELVPVALRHDDDGPIVLEADLSRSSVSRIEGISPGESFPARSTLRFYATITVADLNKQYRSLNEIVIENADLGSWPHNNSTYTQVGTTEFEDLDQPGPVALVLSGAIVTVTAQSEP